MSAQRYSVVGVVVVVAAAAADVVAVAGRMFVYLASFFCHLKRNKILYISLNNAQYTTQQMQHKLKTVI